MRRTTTARLYGSSRNGRLSGRARFSSTSTSAPPSPSRWRPPTSLWTYELESLTLEASAAVERAWRTLSAVMEAHTAQAEAGLESEDE
jgi:hypothetical protein